MSSIGRNKNKLFTCFRPVTGDGDHLVKPTPTTAAPQPLFMHITAGGGKEKTVKLNVIPDSADDRFCNVGCWGGYKKKKKKKTNPRRRLSNLLKRVIFDAPLINRCRRNRETEEKETNSDKTLMTHVSRLPLQGSLVEPEKINRPAPPPMKKKEEFYSSPCVGMSLLLVPLMVLMIWGKGLAIISSSICLYLVPGILKGKVADLCRERDDRLNQSKKKMVIMEKVEVVKNPLFR